MSPAEAARLAGIGRTKIYQALNSGALSSFKIGTRRLIRVSELDAWLRRLEAGHTASETGASVSPSPEARCEDRCQPFAEAALALSALGLAVMPLGGDDGKVALMSSYPKWRQRPGKRTIEKWITAHPSANIGVLCGLSQVLVMDVDAAPLLEPMLDRFGDTPLIICHAQGLPALV